MQLVVVLSKRRLQSCSMFREVLIIIQRKVDGGDGWHLKEILIDNFSGLEVEIELDRENVNRLGMYALVIEA